jgi:hypothetical protein
MPKSARDDRRQGAFAIEREIDHHLEELSLALPQRQLLVNASGDYADGMQLTYTRSDGMQVGIHFSAEELEHFCQDSLPETHAKIRQVAGLLAGMSPPRPGGPLSQQQH